MSNDPFAPLGSGSPKGKSDKAPAFRAIVPVPDNAPARPTRHYKLGEPAAVYPYLDPRGAVLGYACRFNLEDGSKIFRPLVLFEPVAGGARGWRWEGWPDPRPLYGLDRLAGRPRAPVLLCEGEKAADAAATLLPGHVAITSPNGSKSAAKADWRPLKGCHVTIWPDADAAGRVYAEASTSLMLAAGAASVSCIEPPADAPEGWDAADALAAGWTQEQATALVAGARSVQASSPKGASEPEGGGKRVKAVDSLLALTADCKLWQAPDRAAFATFPVGGHVETWPVNSPTFKDWLGGRCYEETGTVPSTQAIDEAVRVMRHKAGTGSVRQEPWIRTGWRDGRLYIDLCDDAWRAIEIAGSPLGPDGLCWRVLERHDLPFVRSPAMLALPVPITDDECDIDELRTFVNTEDEASFVLVVAWLLGALRDRGPYPILVLNGPQGTGKSTLSRLLRSLVDPNLAPIRTAPKDERDLVIAAVNSHCLCLDNLSSVPPWLADALCRLANGGGFATRSMYEDRAETVLTARRPILLNGIPALTDRPDLADRAITVRLRVIPDDERRPEDEMEAAWEAAHPRILAALCDALSRAVARLPTVRLDRAPRSADFAKWVVAAESGLGWDEGTFMEAYGENQRDIKDSAFEASPVAMALDALARDRKQWLGTATQLLSMLNDMTPEPTKRLKIWPETAQGLGNAIERIEPLLRPRGVRVVKKHSGQRTITVSLIEAAPEGVPAP